MQRTCTIRRVATLILVVAATADVARADLKHARPPSVLLIVSDDQRPDTIAALGNSRIQTPNLDRLVRRGTVFTRAVSPNPLCVPSRAEILSGCSGFRNGILPGFHSRLDPALVLWPEAMRRAGYRTWYAGKWDTGGRPTARGYDATRSLFAPGGPMKPARHDAQGREITGYVGWVFQTDDGRMRPEVGVGLTARTDATIADGAVALIEQADERPFFLHVNFTAPHDPLIVPPEYECRYDPVTLPVPPNFLPEHPFDHGNLRGRDEALWPWPRTPQLVREELARYYALIENLDAQVGRLWDALVKAGRADDTIVIFTSDQGLAIGSHGLRGKQNMYEHTVGVPLILAGPGIPAGQRRRAQVYLRDLYPTVCALAGVPIPETVEARDMSAAVTGRRDDGHRLVFGYFMDTQRMVRGDRWKLIVYPKAGKRQLFDLVNDPLERDNRADDPAAAGIMANLSAELKLRQERVGDPLLKADSRDQAQ